MSDGANHTPLKLPAILDHGAAEGFLALMQTRLQARGPLGIDASGVETLTYPCIQIILAALRTYDGISIERPSTAFVSAFEDLAINWAVEQTGQAGNSIENIKSAELQTFDQAAAPSHVCEPSHDQRNESAMSKRILTIDDSKTMRDMLMLTLADAGFEVLQAVDGQDGIDVLVKERVDVVITDINMPRMDGYEVIRQLRSNSNYKMLPILVLTTESEAEKRNLAREVGATGWMVKPFDPDRLVATIRKVAP